MSSLFGSRDISPGCLASLELLKLRNVLSQDGEDVVPDVLGDQVNVTGAGVVLVFQQQRQRRHPLHRIVSVIVVV